MSLGVSTVVVSGRFETFGVTVRRGGPRLERERLELAQWAAVQFRLGIDMNDSAVIHAARELLRLLDGTRLGFGFEDELNASSRFGDAFDGMAARLERELLAGRLLVERQRIDSLTERRDLDVPDLPPLPAPRRATATRTFEVRFVDEVGKAVSGIDAEFTADGARARATNAAGIAVLEGIESFAATVAVLDPERLSKVLDPRWATFRPGAPPKESNTTEVVFYGAELGPFAVKPELPNTIVIKPPLGKLFVELWDKTGRVRHESRAYRIMGPQSFEGVTDENGRVLQEVVFPGDYQLSLSLEFFEGDADAVVENVTTQLVVLEAGEEEPQQRRLGAVPRSTLARLRRAFNTNKAFLLPTALGALVKLRRLYAEHAPCELLVVGHADTRSGATTNDPLSLQRAEATLAYLEDDVDAWLSFYDLSDARQRWGRVEDHLMLTALADFASKPKGEDEVKWFQRTRRLEVDGVAGIKTRTALVGEYMALDGISLGDLVGDITAFAHGAGENFPLDETEMELDQTPQNEKRDPGDRRVELFFFDPEFGLTPKPAARNASPGSLEYPKWLERVSTIVELEEGDADAATLTFIEVTDAHLRTKSAVVLPEGEAPDQTGEHAAFGSVGIVARALRFNDEHAARTILVAGHADTTGETAFNQKLSEDRAEVALCLLKGGVQARDRFASLCDARHTVADIKQILGWVARAIGGFDCDPGPIDDTPNAPAVRRFQRAFNGKKTSLGSSASDLVVDGEVGPLTWGAFFDCFEFALRQELGEEPEEVARLRKKLVFADPDHEFLGFGEHFPIEELGVDQFRSQSNRRVELLFFEPGEQPDMAHAADDPATSELYLPGRYQRTALSANASALRHTLILEWPDSLSEGLPPELTLLLKIGDADPESRLFKDAPVFEGSRRFSFGNFEPGSSTTLIARSDAGELMLWEQQRLDDLNAPPDVLATLQDLVVELPVEGASETAEELQSEIEKADGTSVLA